MLLLAGGLSCDPEPVVAEAPRVSEVVPAAEAPPPAAAERERAVGSTGTEPAEIETAIETGTDGTAGLNEPADAEIKQPRDPLHGEVEPGDSLSRILSRIGLDGQEIHRVSTAMQPLMDPATIRVGQRYDFELDDKGNIASFSFRRTTTEAVRVSATDDGNFIAELDEIETEVREEEIGGTIESSLWGALTKRGHSAALVDVIVDTFAYDLDFFTATRRGDRFRIVVERHEVGGELVRYGRVLAAEYMGGSETYVVLWWQPSAKRPGRYVNAEGKGVSRTLLKTPLKYARISSGFDRKRMHPVLHREKSHNGVDYAAPEGTPIWAAADGKIVHRKLAGGAGNMVIVRHDGGLTTLYMHLSKFAKGQRVGNNVKAKTVIGYVGSTGLATGPHLHFGVKKNGRYVDPLAVESVRGTGVKKGDRTKFKRFFALWRTRLDAVPVR
ncbi:MAG: peptidoglycan DD-metalloendopeptidase family protein [Nannocystaceae bacterium]|nr:peptidoglycan DD-metalloendopeptidase family protein [Nannocystaceae bacterium]